MDYPNEEWIVAKKRDTAQWRTLSLGARSLYLEFTRALGRFTDEMKLGPKGLETVAAFVSAPWTEIKPWLDELLAAGWLVHDLDRSSLRDPQHLERQARTSPEYFVKFYCRNTAAWLVLSLRARGLSLELTRHMGRATDEISIGATGLSAVAALVNAPWLEVQPLLRELLRAVRLVHDKDRCALHDPGHAARQSAQASDAQRQRDRRKRHALSRDVTGRHASTDGRHDQEDEKEDLQTGSPPVVPRAAGDDTTALVGRTSRRKGTLAPDGDPREAHVRAWAAKNGIDANHRDFANWIHWCRSNDTRHADWGEAWKARLTSAHAPASKVRRVSDGAAPGSTRGQPLAGALPEPEDLFAERGARSG